MLMIEMQKREQACLSKLQKLSDRINILEKFQNQPSAKNVDLKEYLKAKGIDIGRYFAPMGYFTPNNMVVSNDGENDSTSSFFAATKTDFVEFLVVFNASRFTCSLHSLAFLVRPSSNSLFHPKTDDTASLRVAAKLSRRKP
jgi:hypothetical protein